MTVYYANVIDMADLSETARQLLGSWVDTDSIRTLDSQKVDGDYVRIVGSDPEVERIRAEVFDERFNVRIETREQT